MAHAQNDANENHWPGYVDALTTMLMVLTFVMMILGIAVFAMSQNVSRIIVETIAKAALLEPPIDDVPVPELTERILEKLRLYPPRPPLRTAEQAANETSRRSQSPTPVKADVPEQARLGEDTRLTSSEQAFVPPAPTPVKAEVAGEALVLEFQLRATRLDEATSASLLQTLTSEARFRQAAMIEVRSTVDRSAPSLSDARRIAYYRAMLVRKAILDAGIPPARIRVHNDETSPNSPEQSTQELVRVIPLAKPD